MLNRLLIILLCIAASPRAAEPQQPPARDLDVLVVVGAPGNDEYEKRFADMTGLWQTACDKAKVKCEIIGQGEAGGDEAAKRLEDRLKIEQGKTTGSLWLALIGHGTFDGREAKFNLRGRDVTPAQLGEWLKPVKRDIVLINTASASAPFLKAVSGPGRIVVSSTKSAEEVFFARYGEPFAKAIGGLPEADIDQDQQVSVLEAHLHASKQIAEFYETEGRLATEHSVIDDNGDGIGTRAELFQGVTAARAADGPKPDGERARQVALVLSEAEARLPDAVRKKRDEIETRLRELEEKKTAMPETAYYQQAESLLVELAKIYQEPAPVDSFK